MINPNRGKYPFLEAKKSLSVLIPDCLYVLFEEPQWCWWHAACGTSNAASLFACTVITAFMTVFLCSLSLLCCVPSLCPFLCTTLLRTDIPQLNLALSTSRLLGLELFQWWNLKSCSLYYLLIIFRTLQITVCGIQFVWLNNSLVKAFTARTGALVCCFLVQHCVVIGAELHATLSQSLTEQFYHMSADKQGLKFIFHILHSHELASFPRNTEPTMF